MQKSIVKSLLLQLRAEKTGNARKPEKSYRYSSFATFLVENVGCEKLWDDCSELFITVV